MYPSAKRQEIPRNFQTQKNLEARENKQRQINLLIRISSIAIKTEIRDKSHDDRNGYKSHDRNHDDDDEMSHDIMALLRFFSRTDKVSRISIFT